MNRCARRPCLMLLASSLLAVPAAAQAVYTQPPDPIPQILDADPTPLVRVSPDRAWLLLLERRALPPIAEVAAPELRLAGDRINPRTNGRSRDITFKGLQLRSVVGTTERRIETPADTRIGSVAWSPDAARIAFTLTADDGVSLWVAEVKTGQSRRLASGLNATAGPPCAWMGGGGALVCRTVPAGRGPAPAAAETPAGPVIQESTARVAPNRTYQDLLQSVADEALFEHYFTSQLARVSLDGTLTPLGTPGIHDVTAPSPDGRYLLVQTVHRPFSYVVPRERFPRRVEVWDAAGSLVRRLSDLGLQEEVPIAFDAVPPGMREASWRDDAPATLCWAEALDGGDPARPAVSGKRDRLYTLAAPFTAEPGTLVDLELRVSDLTWARADLTLVQESWWKTRRTRTWAVNPSQPTGVPRVLFERSSEDRYGAPGRFATATTLAGMTVLLTSRDGRSAYLLGAGASPEGDRPFIDRIDIATGKTTRLWRSEAPFYEEALAVLDGEGKSALIRRESARDVPNYHVRDLRRGTLARLTDFPDPAPPLAGITPQLLRYKRADGVELSATLYLPPGYTASNGRLPFLFWAYPQEFKSAAAAAQVSGSPHRFTRPSGASHLFLLTQGYGVLDNPSMPIVGEGSKEPNDTYVEQLVASAQAAVDKVVEMGVADRARIAAGGHSYGAFMTANLLAHTDLFRAGIARSGAYNRTLTPFGFQAEERPFWKARETYMTLSPFTYADKINEPILLIHGMADNNTGTFPIQSERLYAALKGNGGKARLVMLPAEAHGYRARESVGHTLWEMVSWLDTYLKAPAHTN